jgi:acetolactate synthase-1/2/3 large subunit
MTTNFWRLPRPGTTTIQIDVNPEAIGRNYPSDVAMLGDADLTLRAMSALQPVPGDGRAAWLARVEALRDAWTGERAAACASDAEPVRPERLCADLSKHLPEDAIVVVDTGHAGMWMASMFDLNSPRQSYLRSAGHLGWAFPAGLGAKCACPDRPVVTFTGDLGLWYHIAEIETAVRWGINAVTVVNNNHSGNQSRRGFALAYEGEPTERSRELWVHREVNFAAIAEEIGALGIRVTRPGDFAPALARALEAGRPAIVDVVTDIDAAAPLAWDADDWTQRY